MLGRDRLDPQASLFSDGFFPLTPTLSLGERGHGLQRQGVSNTSRWRTCCRRLSLSLGEGSESAAQGCFERLTFVKVRPEILPLPKGEGWGEGERLGLWERSQEVRIISTRRILTLPPEISPSPRQPSAGRGLGRGASTGLQTWAAVAFRQGGLLSPTLSSKGGEGGPVVGWWQCQDALPGAFPLVSDSFFVYSVYCVTLPLLE